MVKIGCITIDVSHPKAFFEIFQAGDRARYTAVFNDGFRGDEEVEGFMRMAGIEKRAMSVEEVARQVDVGFIHSCNWDKHLAYAEPFFKLGKPVFIDKPVVGNMRDVKALREYVKNGAVVLGCSSKRYVDELTEFMAMPADERGEIMAIHSTCGEDEFNYGIHAVEMIGGLMGRGAVSCQYMGGGTKGDVRGEAYAVQYDSGVIATYALTCGRWQPSTFTVMTTKNTYRIDSKGYEAMLDRVVRSVETGVLHTAPAEDLIESILIMLAGKLSRESGGARVALEDIPDDYPGFDGYAFERGYAAKAKILYK